MSDENADPILGQDLIRVSLEPHYILLVFKDTIVEIGSSFCIRKDDHVLAEICPSSRSGTLEGLWSVVGATVVHFVWSEDTRKPLIISFSNGLVIEILPSDMPRGAILSGEGSKNFVDEF